MFIIEVINEEIVFLILIKIGGSGRVDNRNGGIKLSFDVS